MNKYPYLRIADDPESPKEKFLIILLALVIFTMFLFFLPAKKARADIVSVAQSQIGLGEIGGNNRGTYVRQYLGGRENLPWCAGFVSYCLKKTGYHLPYTLRAKDFLKYGQKINTPKPGDLIVFTRQSGGHIGIVEKVGKETITTIEGNLGEYPAKVKRITYKRNGIKNFLAFVKLQKG